MSDLTPAEATLLTTAGEIALRARRKCLEDPLYLGHHVLGYNYEDPPHFLRWIRDRIIAYDDFLALVARGHGKTTVCNVVGHVWQILEDPEIRVLLLHGVLSNAERILKEATNHFRGNKKLRRLFPEHAPQGKHEDPTTTRFTTPARKGNYKEPTISAGAPGSTETGMHYDVIAATDLVNEQNVPAPIGMGTPESMQKVNEFIKTLRPLLDTTDHTKRPQKHKACRQFNGCLVAGTKVLMSDGAWKAIETVEVGETVVSWDNERALTEARVSWSGKTKTSDVLRVVCRHGAFTATPEHPVLVIRDRPDYDRDPVWVRADELQHNDRVVMVRSWETKRRSGLLSAQLWLLGLLFGDGWIAKRKSRGYEPYAVCLARSVDDDLNNRALAIMEAWFGSEGNLTKFGYYRWDSREAAETLAEMGLHGTAHTKRVPEWVYREKVDRRRAFLEGFIDADGYSPPKFNPESFRVELCNKELLEDLCRLALTSGGFSTVPFSRTRLSQPPNSPEPIEATSWTATISFHERWRSWREGMAWSIVKHVETAGVEDVYDLTVPEHHNFIAEGFVVHNTRWHDGDAYGYMLKNLTYLKSLSVELQVDENGDPVPIWHMISKQTLIEARLDSGPILWAANYLNRPLYGDEAMGFRLEWFRDYEELPCDPKDMAVAITVDPAISEREAADRTAIVVSGISPTGDFYVLHSWAARVSPNEVIDRLLELDSIYTPDWIGIESVAYQKALKLWAEDVARRRGRRVPFRELKADGSKIRRASTMQLHAQRFGIYVKHAENHDLIQECIKFPVGEHDDLVDAMCYRGQDLVLPFAKRREEPKVLKAITPADYEVKGEDIIKKIHKKAKKRQRVRLGAWR